ncbi:hypothetical protein V6N12_037371 [Hibiscus sabdariffa]|uniref:Uncharacterized protein n=1 Tax=Hibiscus sabdariffa TaxID=183260 RepID=A0ABR2BZ22_9ROSI
MVLVRDPHMERGRMVWQFVNGCQAILGPSVASTMLAALLLADTGGSWLWFPSPVPLWRFFQGFSGRSLLLAPVRLWVFVYAPDVSFASWLCYCVTLGSWCKVVRRESVGSFDPCPGWATQPNRGFPSQLLGAQASALVSTCALGGYCIAFQASIAIFLGMTCLAPMLAMVCFIDPLGFVEVCFVQPWARGLLCGLALPFGCSFVQPWARGARLCVANLIGSMSLGGSRTQGCDAKAPCAGWCMPLTPMALGVLVLAMAGASWPKCGLPSPLLDLPPLSPSPSVASSPPASVSTTAASVPAPATTDVAASVPASAASVGLATSVAPLAPGYDATVSAPLPAHSTRDNVHVACDNEAPYDPMLHRDVSDAMEDSLDVPNGCTLFFDLDGMVQSAGLDDVVDEAADPLIRDVASSILGQVSASSATPATVVSTVAACSSPLLPASQPTSTCARRLSMPPVPEQDDCEAGMGPGSCSLSGPTASTPLCGLFFPPGPSSAK